MTTGDAMMPSEGSVAGDEEGAADLEAHRAPTSERLGPADERVTGLGAGIPREVDVHDEGVPLPALIAAGIHRRRRTAVEGGTRPAILERDNAFVIILPYPRDDANLVGRVARALELHVDLLRSFAPAHPAGIGPDVRVVGQRPLWARLEVEVYLSASFLVSVAQDVDLRDDDGEVLTERLER